MYVEEQHLEQLRRIGYFTLEAVMTPDQLESLRAESDRWLAETDSQMNSRGLPVDGLTRHGKRYFIEGHYRSSRAMMNFVHSALLVDIVSKTLGRNVYLFVEQFVVKMPHGDSEFAWHQDSGYIPYPHKPYLSCWCALDDMTEANGTLCMLPYDASGMPEVLPHRHDAVRGDEVGYAGPSPGIPVIVPAGSVVVFGSRVHHRSGANLTDRPRRCYLPQFSAEPIMSEDGKRLRNIADPIVLDGIPVGA